MQLLAKLTKYRLLNVGTLMNTLRALLKVDSPNKFPIVVRSGTHLNIHPRSRFSIHGLLKVGVGIPPGFDPRSRTVLELHKGSRFQVSGTVTLFPGSRVVVYEGAELSIGDQTFINENSKILAFRRIQIGRGCAISWDVLIMDSDSHRFIDADGQERLHEKPVEIGDHVWLGAGVTVLKGVSIGEGSVVAARSVVTHDVPSHSLVAGQPARVIKNNIDWW